MKNKKALIVLGVLLLLILVGGASYTRLKGSKTSSNENLSASKSVFESVKDALNKNLSLSCEFTDDKGSLVKSYIKNGPVRITSTTKAEVDGSIQTSEIILKDKTMYIWDDTTKKGFIYPIEDQETSIDSGVTQETVTSESYLAMIDQYKDLCKVEVNADSLFVTPTDVSFQDMTKFLEDLKTQMPQVEIPQE